MTTQTKNPADFVIPQGMAHAGETLGQLAKSKSGKGYIAWLAKQFQPKSASHRALKAAAQAFLAGLNRSQTPTQAPAQPNGNGHKPAANGNGKATTPVAQAPASPATNGNSRKPAPANGDQKQRPRIFSLVTNKAILHLEDALEIDKVKIFMVAYQRGHGASATAVHYMDVADARVLAADLAAGRLPNKYVEYKGSPKARDGKPLSRVLKVGDRGDQAKRPIVIQVQNGPGELVGEGAIKPAGKPDAEVTIFLTRWEARKMGMALGDYIRAWQAAKFVFTPPETIVDG